MHNSLLISVIATHLES